jgi:hypothetical protein
MASRAGKLVPATTLSVNEACADSTAMGSIEPPACYAHERAYECQHAPWATVFFPTLTCDGSPPLGSSCRVLSTACI